MNECDKSNLFGLESFMEKSKVILLVVFIIFISGCVSNHKPISANVSIVHLITNPKKYDGYRIMMSGYLGEINGWLYMFLTEEDKMMNNKSAAIVVDGYDLRESMGNDNPCINNYVTIVGIFSKIERISRLGISDIESINKWNFRKKSLKSEICWHKNMIRD